MLLKIKKIQNITLQKRGQKGNMKNKGDKLNDR